VSIAREADSHVKSVSPELISSPEIARSLARLSLYDIVILLGKSATVLV
jgi:predicted GTPase